MLTMSQQPDRRVQPRVPFDEVVQIRRLDAAARARARAINLSAGGMFVADCVLGQVGDRINCAMAFTPFAPLSVDCRVAWVRPGPTGDGQPMGMGLCFEDLTATRSQQLTRLMTRLQGGGLTLEAGIPIDPLCESGTWAPEELLDLEDDDAVYMAATNNSKGRGVHSSADAERRSSATSEPTNATDRLVLPTGVSAISASWLLVVGVAIVAVAVGFVAVFWSLM